MIILVILTIVVVTVYLASLFGAVNVMLDQDFELTPAFFLMVFTPILNTIVWCRLSKKANYNNSFKETWMKIFGKEK